MRKTTVPHLVPLTTAPYVMGHMDDAQAERFIEDQCRRWTAECRRNDGHTNRANMVGYEAMVQVWASERAAATPIANVVSLKAV